MSRCPGSACQVSAELTPCAGPSCPSTCCRRMSCRACALQTCRLSARHPGPCVKQHEASCSRLPQCAAVPLTFSACSQADSPAARGDAASAPGRAVPAWLLVASAAECAGWSTRSCAAGPACRNGPAAPDSRGRTPGAATPLRGSASLQGSAIVVWCNLSDAGAVAQAHAVGSQPAGALWSVPLPSAAPLRDCLTCISRLDAAVLSKMPGGCQAGSRAAQWPSSTGSTSHGCPSGRFHT